MVTWQDLIDFISFAFGSVALVCLGLIVFYIAMRLMAVAWYRTQQEHESTRNKPKPPTNRGRRYQNIDVKKQKETT